MLKPIIIILLLVFTAWLVTGFFVNYSDRKMAANELSAFTSCKTIYEACSIYRRANGEYPSSLRILGLENPPYIPDDLAQGIKNGYEYSYEKTKTGFFVSAAPIKQNKTGRLEFSIDESKQSFICNKDRQCMSGNEYFGLVN